VTEAVRPRRACPANVPGARILGIDPGLAATGWGVIACGPGRPRVVACGTIRSGARQELGERLRGIAEGLREAIAAGEPDVAAIEQVLVARNARSALLLGQARGVAILAAAQAGLAVHEYLPMHVKRAVTGYGHAEKDQIQRMLPQLLALDVAPDSADAADALAVALCHLGGGVVPAEARPPRRGSDRAAWTAAVLARAAR
jgi:crossover junction endodeoxyribonuclease RuvC